VAGCNIRALPITPREAFLFSRIDGTLNETDLAAMTGFEADVVRVSVDRLVALGAVQIDPRDATRGSSPQITEGATAAQAQAPRASRMQFRPPRYDVRDLDEPADLDLERKRKVLEFHAQLSEFNYYALLGLSEGCEKKEIKRAYYAIAPDFHPDRFYGKNLGSFKAKMEAIFGQLTFAYETLASPERRAEYDAYLASQQQTQSMEELLQAPAPTEVEPEMRASPGPTVSIPPTPATLPLHTPRPSPPLGTPAGGTPMPTRSPEATERARREALARKLGVRGSLSPEGRRTTPPPTASSSEAAAQELKRRHANAVNESRKAQVQRYVDAAKTALKMNPAAAANAYRLALTLDPENVEIARAHQETAQIAAAALADGYLKQGDYESRIGQWVEAARSYTRAATGMPSDPQVLLRAGNALLKASGDLRQAADFAKRAVGLTPRRIEPRVTLIEIYLAAGMPLAARKEIDAAREIAPHDDRINELSKRLK
jgi:curved DNA-binding protein CbpA